MKEKGFTLVELIGVLVILAVIVLVAFPNILKSMQNTDKLMTTAAKELLITNAKSYWNDNNSLKETIGFKTCVLVKTLVSENYTQTNNGILACQECEKCKNVKSVSVCEGEKFCKECKKSEYNWGVVAEYKSTGKWEYAISNTGC